METGIYKSPIDRADEMAYERRCPANQHHWFCTQAEMAAERSLSAAQIALRNAREHLAHANKECTAAEAAFRATPSGQREDAARRSATDLWQRRTG